MSDVRANERSYTLKLLFSILYYIQILSLFEIHEMFWVEVGAHDAGKGVGKCESSLINRQLSGILVQPGE